jgi:hypothetical protein
VHEIGRAFDKPHSSIRCLLLPRGGIPPLAGRRSRLALTLSEREDTLACSLLAGVSKPKAVGILWSEAGTNSLSFAPLARTVFGCFVFGFGGLHL